MFKEEEFTTFYEYALSKKRSLEKQIRHLKQEISQLPNGKIFCVHDGNRIKWYYNDQNKQIYIPKKKLDLAKQLATKKYLTLLLKSCEKELIAIEFHLRHHDKDYAQAAQNLLTQSEYQNLLSHTFKPSSQELYNWMHEPYETNKKYPEQVMQILASLHIT